MARKSQYKSEYDEQARKFCLLGADDKRVAELLGFSLSTIDKWKKKYPSFLRALKDGKAVADAEVADSLYQRAKGFRWTEQQAIKVKEVTYENGKRVREIETVQVVPTERVAPPDTTAGIFWLKNRERENWRDKHEYDHTTKGEAVAMPLVYLPQDLPREEVGAEVQEDSYIGPTQDQSA